MAKLLAGQTAAAKNDFTALSLTLGVSETMRARAQGAIALIDSGQAGAVPARPGRPPHCRRFRRRV